MTAKTMSTDLEADVEYFRQLTPRNLCDELDESSVGYVRDLAKHLGIAIQYDDGSRKPKDVLTSAIYQIIRSK
jgi:hypothetical protein